MLRQLAVFFAMAALDWCYAFYIMYTAKQSALAAAIWASLLMALNIYVVRSYVEDKSLALPVIAGAFVGTFTAVLYANGG